MQTRECESSWMAQGKVILKSIEIIDMQLLFKSSVKLENAKCHFVKTAFVTYFLKMILLPLELWEFSCCFCVTCLFTDLRQKLTFPHRPESLAKDE